jgi:hypothetical protein
MLFMNISHLFLESNSGLLIKKARLKSVRKKFLKVKISLSSSSTRADLVSSFRPEILNCF